MSDENIEKSTEKDKGVYKCDLCSLSYSSDRDLREHFWSFMHHVNIEQKKKNSLHNCTLCFTACSTLAEYRRHLNGGKHKRALEESHKAEEEKEAAETKEIQEKPTKRSKSPRLRNVEKKRDPNVPEDECVDEEQDFESGGYNRDPIFYKKKNRPHSDIQQETDVVNRHSRWHEPDPYNFTYDQFGNWWDQGYNYDGNYPGNMYDRNCFQNDHHRGFVRKDLPFEYRYKWYAPQLGGFRPPPLPRGAMQDPGFIDFSSDIQGDGCDKDLENEGEEDYDNWETHEGPGGNRWNGYPPDRNSGPWPPWRGNIQRKNSFGDSGNSKGKKGKKDNSKKKKKKKEKANGVKKGKNLSPNNNSPNTINGRKRCRDLDTDLSSSKTSRLTGCGNETNKGKGGGSFLPDKMFSSDREAETLSSSIRSTSSNRSVSSTKSRSSSSSPALRLKTLSARKLQNTRISPKGYHLSPKLKQVTRTMRSDVGDFQDCSESGVLEKAEKLCKELREKRQKAKRDQEKILKSKKNEQREGLNKTIKALNETNKSRIKGHLTSVEKSFHDVHASSSEVSGRESGIATFSSSQTSADLTASAKSQTSSAGTLVSQCEGFTASPTPVFTNDIDRIRHTIENSVRRSNSSPAKTSSSTESPGNTALKSKKPLSKDSLLKMVNSPRSRNERMQLARMLRSHTKSLNKLAPSRLNVQLNGLYDNYEFDEDIPAISLEDLSPEVKLQIAQLIEDEVNTDSMETELLSSSPLIDPGVSLSKPSGIRRLEAMEAIAGYVSVSNKPEGSAGDDALQIGDLTSPEHRASTENIVSIDVEDVPNKQSSNTSQTTEPVVTVTSVNGVPQLQINEPEVTSNSRPSAVEMSDLCGGRRGDQENTRSAAVSAAVDLGRRALQMSGLERFSPIRSSISPSTNNVPSSTVSQSQGPVGVHTLVELSLMEEEKYREVEELDQKIDVMRQMVRRTLEHLEKSEHRRRELIGDMKNIREQRLKVLKDITGHPSLKSPQQIAQPSSPVSDNLTPSRIPQTSESMDMDLVTDTVSSTSHARPDFCFRTEVSRSNPRSSSSVISRPDANSDLATRPVFIPTVSTPCSSFDKEADTNPALSQPSSRDDKPTSSLALSCVAIKQERLTPSPESCPSIASCTTLAKTGDGSSTVVNSLVSNSSFSTGVEGSVISNSSTSFGCFSSSSIPTVTENNSVHSSQISGQVSASDASASESTPVVVFSPPHNPNQSSSHFTSARTETTGEDRLASLSTWSPLADRLMSVSGSFLKRTKSVDPTVNSVKHTVKAPNLDASTDTSVRSINGNPPAVETSENITFEKSAKESTSSGFCSISTVPRRLSDIEKSPVRDSSALRSVRTRTISDSSDGDQSKKSPSVPMTYLGSVSGGVGAAALLKKLAADLGSLSNLNNMSCVMLDKQDISDKFPSRGARTRNNSESSMKSIGHSTSDIQLMELDLRGDYSGKDSTPREESDQSGSVASLGEKIRRYCQTGNRRMSLDTIEGGCSDGDRTLREEEVTRAESPEADNTPGRILKQCSVVLQKLELEKNGDEREEGEEAQEMAPHEEVAQEVQNHNNPEPIAKDSSSLLMKGPVSPGRKKRKTKKERDILANRRSYWFDSSSDNNSQEDETVPTLSSLKQQLVFNQKDDNSSGADQEAPANEKSIAIVKKEIEPYQDQVLAEVCQNNMEATRNAQIDSLLLRLQAEEVDTSQPEPECRPSVSQAIQAGTESSGVTYSGPSDSVTCLQVFNSHLYVSYQGKDIRRYHLQSGDLDLVYNCSYHSVQCMSVVSVPGKEDCIYAGGLSFHLIIFNVKSPQIAHTFELTEEIKCMHHDSGFVYVGLTSGSVEVFDVKNHRHKDSFQCAYQAIHCISSAREGGSKLICVSAQDTTISVCDARSGLPVRILGGHTKTSFSVMSSDHFVFSGSGDRTVMMHNLHTGKLEWTFKEHDGIVTSVWVEGNYLYSAAFDRLVRCFDIKNRCLKRMFYGAGKGVIMSLAVYGDKLYTGSREGLVECVVIKPESWPCQTENCQYVFGLKEHLLHHLLTDHTNTIGKLTRCMWKDCSDWLTLHRDDGSVETHMRKHIDSLEGFT